MKSYSKMLQNLDYWKYPEDGYPKTIRWKVVAGNRKLSSLEDHDLIFDEYDLHIRRLI